MESKAIILMASYNGEQYIKEQINSIIEQTYHEWDLFIRDDGSKDNTIAIIKEYESKDKRIHLLRKNNDKNGACLNFYELLKKAKSSMNEYKYYFLSDQDDIWIPEKMSLQIEQIEKNGERPILVYSNLLLMSEDGLVSNQKMSDIHDINLKNVLNIFYNQIYIWGNTIAFNAALMKYVNIPDNISNKLSHDHYLGFYGSAYGNVIYMDQALTLYRRHKDNISDLPPNYQISTVLKKLKGGLNNIIERHIQSFCNVLYFIDNVPYLTKELKDIQEAYLYNGFRTIQILRKYKIIPGSNKYNIIINWFLLFTGMYKVSPIYKQYVINKNNNYTL